MEPTIHGLTPRQVELLEIMWSLDELEDFESWKSRLSQRDQRTVDDLVRVIILEGFDHAHAQETEYPEAQAVIQRIMRM